MFTKAEGRNQLTELRDMVSCPVDNNIVGNQQVDTLWKAAKRAGDVYQSGYFYINGCFYVDMRCPENIDYSKIIREWAADRKRGLGPADVVVSFLGMIDKNV